MKHQKLLLLSPHLFFFISAQNLGCGEALQDPIEFANGNSSVEEDSPSAENGAAAAPSDTTAPSPGTSNNLEPSESDPSALGTTDEEIAVDNDSPANLEETPLPASCTPGETGFSAESGYVIDQATCVHYQRFEAMTSKLSFAEATSECENLDLGGWSDWRLPSEEELSAIIVLNQLPSVDAELFPGTLVSLYWTNESSGSEPLIKVKALDFSNNGMVNPTVGASGGQAYRCVR
ncbi:MAG: DUF1566 domain-containing protein [Polyangiaceae bacterium]|nr:DUF1566 domain-containing protein [Polyangiaceae bacterium]